MFANVEAEWKSFHNCDLTIKPISFTYFNIWNSPANVEIKTFIHVILEKFLSDDGFLVSYQSQSVFKMMNIRSYMTTYNPRLFTVSKISVS